MQPLRVLDVLRTKNFDGKKVYMIGKGVYSRDLRKGETCPVSLDDLRFVDRYFGDTNKDPYARPCIGRRIAGGVDLLLGEMNLPGSPPGNRVRISIRGIEKINDFLEESAGISVDLESRPRDIIPPRSVDLDAYFLRQREDAAPSFLGFSVTKR